MVAAARGRRLLHSAGISCEPTLGSRIGKCAWRHLALKFSMESMMIAPVN
jgi:hypothetical protein